MWEKQVEDFLKTCSGYTYDRYKAALDEFTRWYNGTYGEKPDATLLTPEEIREWVSYLLTVRKLKASSINLRLSALRGLVRHHGRELRVRGVRQIQPPVETLDGREVGRLLAVLDGDRWMDKRNVAIAALLVRAGLRVDEVVNLRVGDIELNARSGWALVRKGKGQKERKVPLSAEARRALKAYLDVRPERAPTDALFLSKTWKPLHERDVQRMIQEAARKAGIKKRVTPHILRHTFATRFLQRGGDIATLAGILGHERITTTTRYLHPNATKMQMMVEEL